VPHFTALQKAIKAISPETWEFVNDELALYAKEKKIENGRYTRADTSVGKTDIAYPNDARLLNDSVRVLTRTMKRCREAAPDIHFSFHDRTRSSKRSVIRLSWRRQKRQTEA
jgi:hypothetical protein